MEIRLLFATPDPESLDLLHSLLASALELTPLQITPAHAGTRGQLMKRVKERCDDVVVLDWNMAQAGTPALIQELLTENMELRIVCLLPYHYRQYRTQVWQAGACSSIPKEHMEQEWFSSILCVMHRAMQREARIRAHYTGAPSPKSDEPLCCAPPSTTEPAT
ncbi:MAG: hypothetical protein H3C34_16365 [Caldilineaceae bacterium]|nr:hypothetical protein [Caldilineaceae bacterium]